MKPNEVKIIDFWMERKDAYGPYDGDVMEAYGLGDDGIIYFYNDDDQIWIRFVNT